MEPGIKPLSWCTRLKIAAGAAQGLEYLHCKANPPVIYRDLKSSNILLDDNFKPKLSDFGLAKLGPVGDNTHVSTRVMGTYGYCAPEYAMSGKLTLKSDIYSFGVVMLELITGRKAYDNARKQGEQNLVVWVSSYSFISIYISYKIEIGFVTLFSYCYYVFFISYTEQVCISPLNSYMIVHFGSKFNSIKIKIDMICSFSSDTKLKYVFHLN